MLQSLKPGSRVPDSYPELSSGLGSKGLGNSLGTRRSQSRPGQLQLAYIQDQLGNKECRSKTSVSNGQDPTLCSPPKTENEVWGGFDVSYPAWLYTILPWVGEGLVYGGCTDCILSHQVTI